MSRLKLVLLSLFLVFPFAASSLAAQDATPAAGDAFGDLGLPTIDITASASGYEGVPDQLEAGRYVVTLTATDDVDFGAALEFVQPTMVSAQEFFDMVMGMRAQTGAEIAADASPFPQEMATPSDIPGATPDATPVEGGGDEMGGIPQEYITATFAGGVAALAGQSSSVVLDLGPGEWIVWPGDPMGEQDPLLVEVTGEMPEDLAEPESNATIIMGEFVIEVSEGELVAGSNVVRIDNIGAQPHFIVWFQLPDGSTEEQVATILQEEMDAMMAGEEPVYSDLNPDEDVTEVTFTGTQSGGTTIWVTVENIEPGTHGLICFFPDTGDGVPHAYHGMYTVVEIGE
jgi:hypothetical protein